jgi:predicted dienelactone hydrolase
MFMPNPTTLMIPRLFPMQQITLCLLIFASAVSAVPPGFQLPEPTGPYTVGTRYLYFYDTNTPDDHTSDPNDFRDISVQFWYPAKVHRKATPVTYLNKEAAEYLSRYYDRDPEENRPLSEARTHAYLNAQMDKRGAPYPVVLYSPSSQMTENTALFQELASYGYIVTVVGSPHWVIIRFGDSGEGVFLDKSDEYNQAMWVEEYLQEVNDTKEELTTAPTLDAKVDAQRRLNQLMPLESADIRLWAGDLAAVVDKLEELNTGNSFLSGRIDLDAIGAIGYSKGGAAAGQFCVTDDRCRAGVNLSGFMFGDIVDRNVAKPFMILESIESWCENCQPICDVIYSYAEESAYILQVKGATHASFTDWNLHEVLRELGMLGPIDAQRMIHIQNTYVHAFFDKHLKSLPMVVLDGPSEDYPEVVFESRHP